jgi:hypothetical protein
VKLPSPSATDSPTAAAGTAPDVPAPTVPSHERRSSRRPQSAIGLSVYIFHSR